MQTILYNFQTSIRIKIDIYNFQSWNKFTPIKNVNWAIVNKATIFFSSTTNSKILRILWLLQRIIPDRFPLPFSSPKSKIIFSASLV